MSLRTTRPGADEPSKDPYAESSLLSGSEFRVIRDEKEGKKK